MDHRARVVHASSLALSLSSFVLFAAAAVGCSAGTPRVAFAVNESAIAKVAEPAALTPDPPASAPPPSADAKPEAPARELDDVLATCEPDGKKCVLAPNDAADVCKAMNPSAALHVFANNKKLRVAFLTRDMETWSTTQARSAKSHARFDEEVLVLAKRKAKRSVVVQGSAVTYEVLRWDGSCASLMGDELTFRRAPRPVRPLQVARLQLPVRAKLVGDMRIQAALDKAETTCHGGDTTVACDVARRAFGDAVATRAPRLGL